MSTDRTNHPATKNRPNASLAASMAREWTSRVGHRVSLLGLILLLALASSVSAELREGLGFQYAAKTVCGENTEAPGLTVPGSYATAVNILNPALARGPSSAATVTTRLSLTFPEPLESSGVVVFELEPGDAMVLECDTLLHADPDTTVGFPSFVEGFLIIESDQSLDVTSVYTAGDFGGTVRNIDVEPVRERRCALCACTCKVEKWTEDSGKYVITTNKKNTNIRLFEHSSSGTTYRDLKTDSEGRVTVSSQSISFRKYTCECK